MATIFIDLATIPLKGLRALGMALLECDGPNATRRMVQRRRIQEVILAAESISGKEETELRAALDRLTRG
jgi:hypothetical protein